MADFFKAIILKEPKDKTKSVFGAVRLCALQNVLNPDTAYRLRQILRWYSKTFHTPLPEVEELPLEYVLEHYYESTYEEMDEDARDDERKELLMTDEQRSTLERQEISDADEADEFARIVKEEEAAKANLTDVNLKKDDNPLIPLPPLQKGELGQGNTVELPPDIQMNFVDPDDFERELEGFGLMDQPKKR